MTRTGSMMRRCVALAALVSLSLVAASPMVAAADKASSAPFIGTRTDSSAPINEHPAQPAIAKIEAEGNVFVSSPKETAKGERGVYDVDRSRIDLVGGVVLTQGENVVRGDQLEMNLATGESKVTSAQGGGRVRGLFVPEKKGEASSKKKN
jgi:lipopolysaccharide assembly outer membrane protein LptD (OstA)